MKRFYRSVTLAPLSESATSSAFGVFLDDRPVRTPARRPLAVPSEVLAEAIAAEWGDQKSEVRPEAMPLTRLVCTAIDHTADHRQAVIDEIVRYGDTDLLCYRADGPEALVERQAAAWQPVLDWAAETLDIHWRVTAGVVPVRQDRALNDALHRVVGRYEPISLTALHAAAAALGSIGLALGLAEGVLSAEAAWQASQIDETFQTEQWGEDPEAAARRANVHADLMAAARLLTLSHS